MFAFLLKRQLFNLTDKLYKVSQLATTVGEQNIYTNMRWKEIQNNVSDFQLYLSKSLSNKIKSFLPFTEAYKRRLEIASMIQNTRNDLRTIKHHYVAKLQRLETLRRSFTFESPVRIRNPFNHVRLRLQQSNSAPDFFDEYAATVYTSPLRSKDDSDITIFPTSGKRLGTIRPYP